MGLLRDNFWLFLVIGMILVSLVIGLIFVLINKCILKRAAQYKTNYQNSEPQFYTQNNKYHPKHLEEELPPLPPRNTDVPSTPASASYEDIRSLPDYIKVDEKTPPPPYKQKDTPLFTTMALAHDTTSMDSYDDVVSPPCESEDYDDVA